MIDFNTKLQKLLDTPKELLSKEDKAFLKARRDYLSSEQYKALDLDDEEENENLQDVIDNLDDEEIVDIETLSLAELKDFAKEHEINISGLTKKDEIKEAIIADFQAEAKEVMSA